MRERRSSNALTIALLVVLVLFTASGFGVWRASLRAQADQRASLERRVVALETQVAAAQAVDWVTPLTDLQHAVDRLQQDVEGLGRQVTEMQASLGQPRGGATPPPADDGPATSDYVHLAVPVQQQSHPLSCESSAASMAANFLGVPLTESQILDALPRDENPHLGFRGNVDGPTGGLEDYGVYAGPIAAVLRTAGLQAESIVGGLDSIREALRRGHPVLAWITYDTWQQTPVQVALSTGDTVTLVNYQHVVTVTGFDEGGVWVNDPYDGQQEYYANADMERALGYLGDMALEVFTEGQP